MSKRFASVASVLILACGVAAFTGSAWAGNGSGKGAANNTAAQSDSATTHGNAATAPGQMKKEAVASQAARQKGSPILTSTAGVKPASDTSKDTYAPATSSDTKIYGSGQTAGEVAVSSGYTGTLHGPGNSQPHKAALCSGHEVDVHALKARGLSAKCSSTTTTLTTSSAPVATPASHGKASTGSVLGATTSGGRAPAGGVLGALASVGHGTLPFTGLPVWLAVLASIAVIALGGAIRRGARMPT